MIKKNLHPILYKTNIIFEGKKLFELLTTKKELLVDIWSGVHPFFCNSSKIIDLEGRIEKFKNKYELLKENL